MISHCLATLVGINSIKNSLQIRETPFPHQKGVSGVFGSAKTLNGYIFQTKRNSRRNLSRCMLGHYVHLKMVGKCLRLLLTLTHLRCQKGVTLILIDLTTADFMLSFVCAITVPIEILEKVMGSGRRSVRFVTPLISYSKYSPSKF